MHLTLPFSFFLSSLLLIHVTIIAEANQDNATRHRRLLVRRLKSEKPDNDKPTTSCDEPNMDWDATLQNCVCRDGFELDEASNECVDINECEDRNVCGTYDYTYYWYSDFYSREYPSGTCSNTEGGYECECKEGTYYDEDSKTCIETNECKEDPNICGAGVCNNIYNGYICECERGYWHTPIYNPIEKSCSNPGCGTLDVDYYNYYIAEVTGVTTCGGESIGTCEAQPVWYSADCPVDFEAHCSCEQGYKKVNFYDPLDPQYGRNTFPTCIDDSECIGQDIFCTCQEGFQFDYTTHKCVPIICDDIDTFQFPLKLYPDKYVDCDWISKNSKKASTRREKYCDDTHIAAACKNACNKCSVYKNDPDFTFELINTDKNGNTVVQDCAWISNNPNTINDRRDKYCFATDNCTKASEIGDHCPEACGFTEGLHWGKSC